MRVNPPMPRSAKALPVPSLESAPTPIVLVSRDPVLAERIRGICGGSALFVVESVEKAFNHASPLCLIDTAADILPGWNDGFWRDFRQRGPFVVLSSVPTDQECLDALSAGASGYCHAYAPIDTLRSVTEAANNGSIWVGRNVMTRLLKGVSYAVRRESRDPSWSERLTAREREVALLAANGESNQFIAATLGVTERTVKAHLTMAFDKLGVTDRLQLALKVHGIR